MRTVADFNALGHSRLTELMGIVVVALTPAPAPSLTLRMEVQPRHWAPHDFIHGGAIAVLADTACGYGAYGNLPNGATGFFTVESKTNHLGAVRAGTLECVARPRHLGRSTQVWEADVTALGSGKPVALFRCTQMLLYATGDAA